MTTNQERRDDLDKQRCNCTAKHAPCQGRDIRCTDNYTPAMAKLIVQSLTRSPSPDASISCAAQLVDKNAMLLDMLDCHKWRKQTHRTGIAESHTRTFHTSKVGKDYSKCRVQEQQQSEYHAHGNIYEHVHTMLPEWFTRRILWCDAQSQHCMPAA